MRQAYRDLRDAALGFVRQYNSLGKETFAVLYEDGSSIVIEFGQL